MEGKIYEYRGVEGLVYAELIDDSSAGISYGEVKTLAGVAEIGKETDSNSETHYYSNMPAIVVTSEGSDTLTISASAIPLEVLADITGQTYDASKAMLVEGERTPKYFAIGYITSTTSGEQMYVWRLKGMFNIPGQTVATKNNGTDANGQELTYTGIDTIHKFTYNGENAKAVTVNASKGLVDVSGYFDSVQTPDTIEAIVPSITLSTSTANGYIGETETLTATTVPVDAVVTWTSSDNTTATVSNGLVTYIKEGTATITASITFNGEVLSATCAVTVAKPSVTVSSETATVAVGSDVTLTATTVPADATVTWTSADGEKATVEGGVVHGVAQGEVVITASITVAENEYTDSCTVTVTA